MDRKAKPKMKLSVNKVSGRRRAAAKADGQSPDVKIKANDMKPAPVIAQPDSAAQEQAAKQELVAPHEWATLLNAPENEFSDLAGAPVPEAQAPQAEAATDDLWERLSSTRWIKVAPEHDLHNRSTIANRPSEN
jgi:hypothetical protein